MGAIAKKAREAEENLRRAARPQKVLGREGIAMTRKQA